MEEFKVVPISLVEPDPNQPRRDFDARKLSRLADSITRLGIKNPISVEKTKHGKYQIIDGERRYRASKVLGLKTIPVFISEPLSDTERIVQQFHLQELNLAWSPYEKAIAIRDLAQNLKTPIGEVGAMLGMEPRTLRDYIMFINLEAHKDFEKSELPIKMAGHIESITKIAKSQYIRQTGEDFNDDKDFQIALIERVKKGDITNYRDFSKIKDAIVKNARVVKDIVQGKKSTEKIFIDSDAGITTAVRMFNNIMMNVSIQSSKFLATEGTATLLNENEVAKATLRGVMKKLQEIANQLD